ncbi:MAG: PRC-barrel domain-containing protein [Acetobacteraceae bacterium]|nr:PRC-barrel domain-containing protein [Pseudomonadota bacterium]
MPRAILLAVAAVAALCPGSLRAQEPPASKPPPSIESVPPETTEAILGRPIVDPNGKDIGQLVDVLVDDGGRPRAAVIDYGGFLGVGARKIAVHWSALRFNPALKKHRIMLDMTPDEIKAAPSYDSPDKPASVVTPAVTPADAASTPR